jgi:AcrR family transcriptional regulator
MHDMHSSPDPIGLRERKRLQTRRTIARVALELFDRQGFHETTIPQIAEAADVSPRTVSAYFPRKEDLAFPDVAEEFRAFASRLRDRRPGETATDAMRAFIRSTLEQHGEQAAERRVRRRVIRADEGLRAHEHHHMLRAQEILAAGMAHDLGVAADDLEARMAAAATLTVFELLEDYDTRDATEALAAVDRALLFIGGGIRALRGPSRTAS